MKTTLLLLVFASLAFQTFSQYSRSFYSVESTSKRHSSIYSFGGETTALSIRESSSNSLRVTLIDLDEFGETSNYRMFENNTVNIQEPFALSGVGVNSTGEVTLCILNHNTSGSADVHYITVDPTSGTFSNSFSINGLYRRGFCRTRSIGDSLITYLANHPSGGITRVAKSLSNSGTSSQLATANSTFSGSLFNFGVTCELLIDGSDEYVGFSNGLIKHSASGNFIETSFSGLLNAPDIALKSSGELFALNAIGDYSVFDGNLVLMSSGNIPGLQTNLSSTTELYALPNNELRLWRDGNGPNVIDISSAYVVSNQQKKRSTALDQLVLNGKQYIIGHENNFNSVIHTDGTAFQNQVSSVSVVSDDLSGNIEDFIEYNQELFTDKIRYQTNHVGRSFTNDSDASAGFSFYQNDQYRNLIYTATSNLLGTTVNGALVGTTNTFESGAANGPYTAPGNYSLEVMDKYNRGYYVTADMIETHIAEITSGNPSYKIPFGILEWPAHGDASLGQATNLAGFIDLNANGNYDPELGDYPAIYGDQCLLNMYHEHPNTPNSASSETHQYYFTFDCDTEEAIENTVFIRSHVFLRNQSLFDTYSGTYIDFDLGNFSDDYIGTNVELGMIYSYNGDLFDESNGGNIGFMDTIPAVGMISLQGAKLDQDGIDNTTTVFGLPNSNGIGFSDGIVDNEYYTMESSYYYTNAAGTGPVNPSNWYNVMQGLNADGSQKMVNGVTVRHDFFGNSDPIFYTSYGVDHGNNHSEITANNPAGDRRISSASGPSTFAVTDTMILINAFVVGVDTTNLSPSNSLDRLFEHGQTLRDIFAQDSDDCGNSFGVYQADNQLSIKEEDIQQIIAYPNPATQHIQFKGISGTANLTIFDLNGRVVLSQVDMDDSQSIDISSLDKAIYMISISDEHGNQTIRMIKH